MNHDDTKDTKDTKKSIEESRLGKFFWLLSGLFWMGIGFYAAYAEATIGAAFSESSFSAIPPFSISPAHQVLRFAPIVRLSIAGIAARSIVRGLSTTPSHPRSPMLHLFIRPRFTARDLFVFLTLFGVQIGVQQAITG